MLNRNNFVARDMAHSNDLQGMFQFHPAETMEHSYLKSMAHILEHGVETKDRTGVGTYKCFGMMMKFPLYDSYFPAVTTKKLAWKAMSSELIWFLEGSGDEKRLREILHGDYNSPKGTIWTDNLNADYWKHKSKFEGDLGRIYGVQWRSWRDLQGNAIDQLANVIHQLKNEPFSRRIILSAWNPGELSDMALPPCHTFSQFSVNKYGELDCLMYQRSGDFFLGIPFNIASYSLLTHMLAQVTGLKPGMFTHVVGDAHIYSDHVEQVKLQLSREIYTPPKLDIDTSIKNINDFKMDSFRLVDYKSHEAIKANMAV